MAAKAASPSPASRPVTANRATVASKPATERTPGVTMRVAIAASIGDTAVFVVRRLAKGQPLPAGTKEATLVLSSEDDGSIH
jgi:hypothetical protein